MQQPNEHKPVEQELVSLEHTDSEISISSCELVEGKKRDFELMLWRKDLDHDILTLIASLGWDLDDPNLVTSAIDAARKSELVTKDHMMAGLLFISSAMGNVEAAEELACLLETEQLAGAVSCSTSSYIDQAPGLLAIVNTAARIGYPPPVGWIDRFQIDQEHGLTLLMDSFTAQTTNESPNGAIEDIAKKVLALANPSHDIIETLHLTLLRDHQDYHNYELENLHAEIVERHADSARRTDRLSPYLVFSFMDFAAQQLIEGRLDPTQINAYDRLATTYTAKIRFDEIITHDAGILKFQVLSQDYHNRDVRATIGLLDNAVSAMLQEATVDESPEDDPLSDGFQFHRYDIDSVMRIRSETLIQLAQSRLNQDDTNAAKTYLENIHSPQYYALGLSRCMPIVNDLQSIIPDDAMTPWSRLYEPAVSYVLELEHIRRSKGIDGYITKIIEMNRTYRDENVDTAYRPLEPDIFEQIIINDNYRSELFKTNHPQEWMRLADSLVDQALASGENARAYDYMSDIAVISKDPERIERYWEAAVRSPRYWRRLTRVAHALVRMDRNDAQLTQ